MPGVDPAQAAVFRVFAVAAAATATLQLRFPAAVRSLVVSLQRQTLARKRQRLVANPLTPRCALPSPRRSHAQQVARSRLDPPAPPRPPPGVDAAPVAARPAIQRENREAIPESRRPPPRTQRPGTRREFPLASALPYPLDPCSRQFSGQMVVHARMSSMESRSAQGIRVDFAHAGASHGRRDIIPCCPQHAPRRTPCDA